MQCNNIFMEWNLDFTDEYVVPKLLFGLVCYPIVLTVYVTGTTVGEIANIPNTVRTWIDRRRFVNDSSKIYVDFETYRSHMVGCDDIWHLDAVKRRYKDAIYVLKKDIMVKAPLLINKVTKQMAYVVVDG